MALTASPSQRRQKRRRIPARVEAVVIAVAINNLESVKREQQATAGGPRRGLLQAIDDIRAQLDGL